MEIAIELQNKIVEFFKSLPNIEDVSGRQALILSVGLDLQLQDQISVHEPLAQFVPLFVSKLLKYGSLNDGRNALEATLEATKGYIGQDRRQECDNLLQELQTISQQAQTLAKPLKITGFELGDDFQDNLNAVGASFSHPHRTTISLENLFIYPDLKDIDIDINSSKSDEELNNIFNSSILLDITEEDSNKFLIVGDDKSGKTSLCKMLYKSYHAQGYVPLYIEGCLIKHHSTKRFNGLVNQCFKHQYSKDALESFNRLTNTRKILIIDNFDQSALNLTFKHALIKELNSIYPYIIITGNNFFQLEEILSGEDPKKDGAFADYTQFSILEFGHQLRSQLINIWNTLGREESVEYWALIRKNDFVERIVNTIIGNNLVPSYPLFLLTILQSVEAGTVHDLKESVYSHYYEYLITHALIKTNIGPDELDAYHNYITELSYCFFAREIKEISQTALQRFHQWFCNEYSLTLSFDVVVTRLANALILKDNRGVFRFRYRYVYYFFVAKYFADNFSEDAIKQKISEMCKALYREEFANIILFLTHHSKEPFILEEILQNAKSHFAEFEIVQFDEDFSTINTLLDEIPQLVLNHIDIKENRERHHKMQDALELSNGNKPDDDDDDDKCVSGDNEPEMDLITKLNSAFKTIEILGQVLKNYYGSLKGKRKLALGEELYFIGLRALNAYLTLLEENKEAIGAKITSLVEERSMVSRSKSFKKVLVFFIFLPVLLT